MSDLRGRFDGPIGDDLRRFASSIECDLRLLDDDIVASIAHARMLGERRILRQEEADALRRGLEELRDDVRAGRFLPDPRHEDVHMAVEARLVEQLGEVGKKLHTARSRNDQVATDVRLWLKRALVALDRASAGLIATLLARVESDGRTLLPGYTHLQRGQPILLGHHLLAHAFALARDRERFADALRRVDRSPLGACALAGTSHPIDRERTAELLGFGGLIENAMDAVSARDHEQEVAAACAICMTHLSRMAEELVLWSSSEFGLVRLADAYATGSSVMPQKRNPDGAELVRGKAARVYGDLQALLALVKGLPLAYNRDLQEDRHALFDALDTTAACLGIMDGMWRTLAVERERFETELHGDTSLATDWADALVERGVPFREAHEILGRVVRRCAERGGGLDRLTADEAERFHPALGEVRMLLDPRAAAERRTSRGGTAWREIERQIALLRRG
jgi:argininosuccinate lyase